VNIILSMTGSIVVVLTLLSLCPAIVCFVVSSSSAKAGNKPHFMAAGDTPVKKPWEFFRFLKTASFYGAFKPKLPFLKEAVQSGSAAVKPGMSIWDLNDSNPELEWGPLDDVVMGGASKSDLAPGGRFDGIWSGFVTTANNGGFAGIRSKIFSPVKDASLCRGLVLKIKGDGKRYKFIARDDTEWNGIAWSTSFDTKSGQATEVKIPWNKLIPTRFARTVQTAPFDTSKITGIQLSLSKFEYDGGLNPNFNEGPFRLEVEKISFF
jgi:Complex I intermediate-associated protein 30 (CIA30)